LPKCDFYKKSCQKNNLTISHHDYEIIVHATSRSVKALLQVKKVIKMNILEHQIQSEKAKREVSFTKKVAFMVGVPLITLVILIIFIVIVPEILHYMH